MSALTAAGTLSNSILQPIWTHKKASKINVIDHRTCNLLLGDFCHYNFLILQYIWHRMRYVSPQRKVTLLCNIKLIYLPKIYSIIFWCQCSGTIRHSYIIILACMCPFYCRMAFKSVLIKQKCVTYITLLHTLYL